MLQDVSNALEKRINWNFQKNKSKLYSPGNSISIAYKGKGEALKWFRPFNNFSLMTEMSIIIPKNRLEEKSSDCKE